MKDNLISGKNHNLITNVLHTLRSNKVIQIKQGSLFMNEGILLLNGEYKWKVNEVTFNTKDILSLELKQDKIYIILSR